MRTRRFRPTSLERTVTKEGGRALALQLCALLLLLTAGSCKRPCADAENCKRTCECVDNTTGARQDCTMAFRCDGANAVCEDDYDGLSCDEVCSRYAAKAQCGLERCSADADCVKALTCPILDPDNQPTGQFFNCTIGFLCNIADEVCASESTLDDTTLCSGADVTNDGVPDCVPPGAG